MTRDISEGTLETELRSRADAATEERLSDTGSRAWNVATGTPYWSDEAFRILGLAPGSVEASFETFLTYVRNDPRLHH